MKACGQIYALADFPLDKEFPASVDRKAVSSSSSSSS
jgi:hypothetical protein